MAVGKHLTAEAQQGEQQLRPVENQHQPLSRKGSSPLIINQTQQMGSEDSDQTRPKPNQSPPAAIENMPSQVPVQQSHHLPMELRTPQPVYPSQAGVPDQGMMQGMPMMGAYSMMPMLSSQGNVVFVPMATQGGAPQMYMHPQQAQQMYMQQQMPMQQHLSQQPPMQQHQQPPMQQLQQQPPIMQHQQQPPMQQQHQHQQQLPMHQQQPPMQQQPLPSVQDQVQPQLQQQPTQPIQQGGQQAQIPPQQLQQVQPTQSGQQVATSVQGQQHVQPHQQPQTTAALSTAAPTQSVAGGAQPQQSQAKAAQVAGVARLKELDHKLSQLHKKPNPHQQQTPAKVSSQAQPPPMLQQQISQGQGVAGQANVPYHNQVSVSVAQLTTPNNSQSSANIVLTPQPVSNMLAPVFHPIQDERKASLMDAQSLPIHNYLPRPASEPVPDYQTTPYVDPQQDSVQVVPEKSEENQIQIEQPARPVSPKPASSPTKKSRFSVSSVEDKKDAAAVIEEKPKEEISEGNAGSKTETVEDKSSREPAIGMGKDQEPARKEEKKGRFTVAPAPCTAGDAVKSDQVKSGETATQDVKDVVSDLVSDLVSQTEKNIDKEVADVAETAKPSAGSPVKLSRFQVNKVSDKTSVVEGTTSAEQSVPETASIETNKDDQTDIEKQPEAEQPPLPSATASLAIKEADREPSPHPQQGNEPAVDLSVGPAIKPERKSSLIGSERDTPDSIASDGSSLPSFPPEGPTLQQSAGLPGQPFGPGQGVFAQPESQSTPPLSDVGSASPGPIANVSNTFIPLIRRTV